MIHQPKNYLAFDIETVPDVDTYRRLKGISHDIPDLEIAEKMFAERQSETESAISKGTTFLKHPLHKIACISAVLRKENKLYVGSIGFGAGQIPTEKESIQKFFDLISTDAPTLVSWNGSAFDLPVLHYRSMLHAIPCKKYWDNGVFDRDFKYDNYLSRYHERHTDLMDVISCFSSQAKAPLDMVSSIMGYPGKMGMDGSKVSEAVFSGNIRAVADYCEIDALNTYLLFMRWQMMRERISMDEWMYEEEFMASYLADQASKGKTHFGEFLEKWEQIQALTK